MPRLMSCGWYLRRSGARFAGVVKLVIPTFAARFAHGIFIFGLVDELLLAESNLASTLPSVTITLCQFDTDPERLVAQLIY